MYEELEDFNLDKKTLIVLSVLGNTLVDNSSPLIELQQNFDFPESSIKQMAKLFERFDNEEIDLNKLINEFKELIKSIYEEE